MPKLFPCEIKIQVPVTIRFCKPTSGVMTPEAMASGNCVFEFLADTHPARVELLKGVWKEIEAEIAKASTEEEEAAEVEGASLAKVEPSPSPSLSPTGLPSAAAPVPAETRLTAK